MPPELPPFIKRIADARARRSLPPGPAEVAPGIGDLYDELWAGEQVEGWLESPRGRWVSYQLDWFESRCRGVQ
jgi:diadenosine tetraphosphatase ApaH/serine/threonine PP2A family protein phosphatase